MPNGGAADTEIRAQLVVREHRGAVAGEYLLPVLLREQLIQTCAPSTPTELTEFRKRIREEGVELILKESIYVNDDHDDIDKSFIDSTVQEKNITFPTNAKLTKKIISR